MSDWIDETLSTLKLGDARLVPRAKLMIRRMAQNTSGSIPQTMEGDAERKAAYRLLSSDNMDPEAVQKAMSESTVARMEGHDLVLAVQDTTTFNFTHHPGLEGVGPIRGTRQRGVLMHTTLALSADGVPLGVLDQEVWEREESASGGKHKRKEKPIDEKESKRWVESLRKTHEAVGPGPTVLTVADREADIFEMFAEPRPENSELLIRACRNRRWLKGEQRTAYQAVMSAPLSKRFKIEVSRRPDRAARTAEVELRFCEVILRPPKQGVHAADLKPVKVSAVAVWEPSPADGGKPIEWVLLTTLPVRTQRKARQIVHYYTLRWPVERYHYALKSGCRIEQSQLRTAERFERLLALYCVVAWRVLWVVYAARAGAKECCTQAFTMLEWQILHRIEYPDEPLPDQPPTLAQAVTWVAKLGGYPARNHDRPPGIIVIWRGLRKLCDMARALLLFHPELVGNA